MNRLALDAEQLAKSLKLLNRNAKRVDPPKDRRRNSLLRKLQERATELGLASSQLGQELNALLQREQELLTAARKAESDKLNELYSEAAELAQQQQRIADGVAEESRDAPRANQPVADQLNAIRQEQEQLRQEAAQNQIDLPRPKLSRWIRPREICVREISKRPVTILSRRRISGSRRTENRRGTHAGQSLRAE